ncbi:tripartite tricarboxylate transporter substrate binding protein [Cupriavidus sp. CV2]|uniref:Bug family tripartite tricarboxylate transporter substrate binding protein n=1 Tax=Cupriavidus ulmosensis TaxID=3065913 RepID=UPI00296B57D1|nr:tripartite tricarboxylate transporter substrate binding protein [Cupriavidus sp. CV2]MDW3683321.1 tripartite tricarboxylate transporter substrate binding protein [Cupriavidus sp. CV2]
MAEPLGKRLKQPVIIENKPGANGVLATQEVARSAADGHTLVIGVPATIAINPSLYKLSFDPIKDLRPVAQLAIARFVIVTAPSSGIQSLQQLIAQAKANPGKYSYASYGNGSAPHLAGQMLTTTAGVDINHIPYKGSTAALFDVISGRVSFMFDVVANVQQHVQAGTLKVIAAAGEQAPPQFPNVPTAQSVVPGLALDGWVALFAPVGTPAAVVNRLSTELNEVLKEQGLKRRLTDLGFDVVGSTPEQLLETIRKDHATYTKAVQSAGLRNE